MRDAKQPIRVAAATILLVAGLATGTVAARPLLEGTKKADTLRGGPAAETIRGGRGNDRLSGGGGNDLLLGGPGRDRLNGGRGRDVLEGGAGRDRLEARDGKRDRVGCGPGRDTAVVDRGDRVRGCENVELPKNAATKVPPTLDTPLALAPTPAYDLIAAGDIADCTGGAEQTARLVDGLEGAVAVLGDAAYTSGSPSEFANCYAPTWGRHLARTRPAVGDNEYETAGAAGYFAYFGLAAGEVAKGWYSYSVGSWHVVVLNSNCDSAGGCGPASPQGQWLSADLAASPAACTLAYWHSPRFSSGYHGDDVAVQPLWQTLHDAGAEIVLTGHDHDYERFAPQTAAGAGEAASGIREFVVGTGGRSLRPFVAPRPNSEVRNAATFGVLGLKLAADAYEWRFIPVAGGAFTDAGSGACH